MAEAKEYEELPRYTMLHPPFAEEPALPVASSPPAGPTVVAEPITSVLEEIKAHKVPRGKTRHWGGRKSRKKKKKSRGKKRTQKNKKKSQKKKKIRRKKRTRKRRKSSTYSLPIGNMLETFGEDDAILL